MEEEDLKNFSPTLFRCGNGSPFKFFIKNCFDKPRLTALIEAGGGEVVNDVGPFSITLVPPHMAYYRKEYDAFGYDFILECLSRNKVLDLNLFRIGLCSKKYKAYDANDILFQRICWDDIPAVDIPKLMFDESCIIFNSLKSPDKSLKDKKNEIDEDMSDTSDGEMYDTNNEDNEESTVISNGIKDLEVNVTKHCKRTLQGSGIVNKAETSVQPNQESERKTNCSPLKPKTSFHKKRRAFYRVDEQKKIVSYIIESDGYERLKGIKFWKEMENSNEFPGRTYHSLKEHFIKKIYPQLHLYKLSQSVLKKFRYGMTKSQ